jgi:hypothetical protein
VSLLRRIRRRPRAGRDTVVASLLQRQVIGYLTPTGNATWDDQLNRAMLLPAGPHLLALGPAGAPADHLAAATLAGAPPQPGTLLLIEPDGDIHTWDLTGLLQRADDGDDQAREALHELVLHVQQRALEAVAAGFPRREA